MFETAELGRALASEEYKKVVPELRQELLEVQRQLLDNGSFQVILIFAGVDGAGKSEIVNLLNSWMDPRWLVTHAYGPPSDEESERPEYWRYWRDLPPKGQIGLLLSTWYSRPILDYVYGEHNLAKFDKRLDRITGMEKGLADNGALILKFWLHLDKESQQTRFKKLEQDPLNAWRVTDEDWKHWELYDGFMQAAEHTIRKTSTGEATWHIVEGGDLRYSSVTVAKTLCDSIRNRIEQLQRQVKQGDTQIASNPDTASDDDIAFDRQRCREVVRPEVATVLSALNNQLKLSKADYNQQLSSLQGEVNQLQHQAHERNISTLLVFEGADAAGKGGAIRRVISALDAKHYKVVPVAAPTDEERAQHYLWRFWRHLPRAGRLTLFDRSWYGRVLVERVEGFASEQEWRRAYREINDFEEQLAEHDILVIKYWLHITPEEQLARFDARAETPYKQWKLTDEDWRNRNKWADYELAVHDMVERTSTSLAPWTLVEANDKRYARIKVLKTLQDRLQQKLTTGS
ncbi:polyphosphate:AMP phosphotransferase [Motiliproteus coralliicola]|uniref:Polyphosphate:AMP phosphotransferase n=1 Tax=Motiliproteus coralliicola TaxID=2283196 RepID=A0A369WH56_9GAMM|nr:polyphosphate:AMP phosphotransferase [Motiliproteus coralliicola]RDE19946.1 polyphosphate:AMP phosphotransferase [Motiliproteus coralliicola]